MASKLSDFGDLEALVETSYNPLASYNIGLEQSLYHMNISKEFQQFPKYLFCFRI